MTFALDDSDLTRAEVRALLLVIQGGRCGICRRELVPGRSTHADHDHDTGLLRGLLCNGCNRRASRHYDLSDKRVTAYLAYPPAGPLFYMWDFPDWWTARQDTEAAMAAGVTVLGWVLSNPSLPARRRAAAEAADHAAMLAANLPSVEGL